MKNILRTLINSMASPIFAKDLNFVYTECNEAFEKYLGLKREEIIGKTAFDISPKEKALIYQKADEELLKSKTDQVYETLVRYADGTDRNVIFHKTLIRDENQDIKGIVGIITDITERKKIEATIYERHQLLQTITHASKDAIIMINSKGEICFWNEASQQIFGWNESECLGKNLHLLIAPKNFHETHNKAFPHFQRTGEGAAVGKTLELIGLRKDSTEFPLELSLSSIKIKDTWHAVGIVRDITDKKKTEKENIELQKKMFHKERLASIGTLSAGLAHEINNPLTIIKGFVEILEEELKKLEPQPKHIDLITKSILSQKKSIERISNIVGSLRTLSRDNLETFAPVDLEKVIEDTLLLYENFFAKRKISIIKIYNAKDKIINGNTGKLEQVLLNLFTNAKDALLFSQKPQVKIETLNENSKIIIKISNNGMGIEKENLDKIFDPFFTTKEPGEGTGLGLSITQSIVKSLKGEISVSSQVSKGATFSISFPLAVKTL